ncbi:hypothetical protein LTR36_010076 [Oleoguttula mirabilis]|uniref:RING-type domain-containing protein n=1 Tax=Oleoguttula mirabilis TaxID=1507867 RepID=A0AAV9JT17_9PEZI|nr:hypothetical protein LTR36_010076 [Oleoguttula mirabilis]
MGQGASQPERRGGGGGGGGSSAESQQNRRRSILRQSIRHSTVQLQDGDGAGDGEDVLLRGQHSGARRRPRPASTNRLSQLLRPVSTQPEATDPAASSRGAGLQRTASRLRDMLSSRRERTRDGEAASARPALGLLQHRTSYVRAGMNRDGSDYYPPPRLPSIDVSSTFDHETFAPPDEPEPVPRATSSRRSNLRFNALRPDRPFRHFTSSLRRRRSPQPSSSRRGGGNEDQAAMLSRLLSVAAAATAATLMGDDHQALSEARSLTGSEGMGDIGSGGEDGSFDGFLRALQNGRIASALRQGGDADGDSGSREGPLNFFRMFRFGASGSNSSSPLSTGLGDPSEASDGASDGRMVPIIIVGIRSISPNSGSGPGSAADDLPPFIDALGNFPSPLPATALGAHGQASIDSILRPPQNGTSFRHRRRASMGGFGIGRSRISDRLDDQRDHRSPDRRRERPWSVASSSSTLEPRPPPATPASPSPELSRMSSRNSTPSHSRPASFVANSVRDFSGDSRRNSALHRASAASPLSSHTEETSSLHSTHSGTNLLSGDDASPFRFHSHRRSDTAPNIHYPRFASGHPRRNGVVEPDHLPPLSRSSTSNATESSNAGNTEGRNSNTDSRSWIIYVLGGSYPENHPILTTPSLFTENPTYEDMMLLSALLGPAKAPVASEEDVESAGGVYTVEAIPTDAAKTAELVAVATDGSDRVEIEGDQRCLVCLCEFEAKEICRKLVKCSHLFHKECIDQWLTEGRNSCPLCRGQGVDEKEKPADEEAGSPSNPAELDAGIGA